MKNSQAGETKEQVGSLVVSGLTPEKRRRCFPQMGKLVMAEGGEAIRRRAEGGEKILGCALVEGPPASTRGGAEGSLV